MSWTSALTDLRILLSDNATDKLRANKAVFGMQNGTNTIFKTFEFRRLTDFASTATAFPFGIALNGSLISAASVVSDDPDTGFFRLTDAPTDADQLTTTYYIQWFLDSELTSFLVEASNWIGFNDEYEDIPSGLRTAALKYAAHAAYQKLSLKYAEDLNQTYRLEDAPDKERFSIVDTYQKAAKVAMDEAMKYRDDYYTRKGAGLAPRFGTISGGIKNPTRS